MVLSKRDVALLFATRTIRLFAYGFLSVVLVLYLIEIGLDEARIGLLLSLTLVGDAAISLGMTTVADRVGRGRMLLGGAFLMIVAGIVFISTRNPLLLLLAAIVGVISPSGNEIGPFLSIEQAALSQLLPATKRTWAFSWYNLAGSLATATGALSGGALAQSLQQSGFSAGESYRVVLGGYVAAGCLLVCLFLFLSPAVETASTPIVKRSFGLHRSQRVVASLSLLFALDAFAGGFVVQSLMAYWFHQRFGVDEAALGGIFFGANILAGLSALLAARLAERIGLIRTMVFTHLPSNVLLCLIPLMPTLSSAIGVLLVRFSISQMDVPTRQAYTMAVVAPDERAAASGITTIARSLGASLSPALSGLFLTSTLWFSAPFFLAGGLKIVYDLLLYRRFQAMHPGEEEGRA